MQIKCNTKQIRFNKYNRKTKIIEQAPACFTDHRDPGRTEHTVDELMGQRMCGIALGYLDMNDHDLLRCNPLLALLADKKAPM